MPGVSTVLLTTTVCSERRQVAEFITVRQGVSVRRMASAGKTCEGTTHHSSVGC